MSRLICWWASRWRLSWLPWLTYASLASLYDHIPRSCVARMWQIHTGRREGHKWEKDGGDGDWGGWPCKASDMQVWTGQNETHTLSRKHTFLAPSFPSWKKANDPVKTALLCSPQMPSPSVGWIPFPNHISACAMCRLLPVARCHLPFLRSSLSSLGRIKRNLLSPICEAFSSTLHIIIISSLIFSLDRSLACFLLSPCLTHGWFYGYELVALN